MNTTDAIELSLINRETSSIKYVLESLVKHENDTEWSAKTTHFAISRVKEFEQKYGNHCAKGFLPKEFIFDILLPSHGHMEDFATGILLFPDDVAVKEALGFYKKPHPNYTKDCSDRILFLKDEIKKNGFSSKIIIEFVNGKLRHVDGLHRLLALSLLLEEGYEYEPIPVYVLMKGIKSSIAIGDKRKKQQACASRMLSYFRV